MDYLQLLYDGLYDELVQAALPVLKTDKNAERAFLRLFMSKNATVLLDFHDSIEPLIKEAENGDAHAQYAYARWQILYRKDEESVTISYRNMEAAAEQNLPDAIAGYAAAFEYGDSGTVDWEKADELLEKAIAMGSELGKKMKLQDLCFGKHYLDAQPELATNLANQYIAQDEAAGIEPNGWWYYYRACAQEGRFGKSRVKDDYQLALDRGVLEAYGDLIINCGYGDNGEALTESEEYHMYLRQGIAHLATSAFCLDAAREMKNYDYFEDNMRQLGAQKQVIINYLLRATHDLIRTQLSNATKLKYAPAWEQLGDMYYYGEYGCDKDYEQAFFCYTNGIIHDSETCAEKAWKMMHDHLIDKPLDYVDQVALRGARWGSKRLLAETVIAHQEGRLSEYDEEISKYYDTIFDSPEFTLDNDEDWQNTIDDLFGEDNNEDDPEDDDGRYDAWA